MFPIYFPNKRSLTESSVNYLLNLDILQDDILQLFLFSSHILLIWNLGSIQGKICNWPPYIEGEERSKKEVGHWRSGGGRFNKQGNLHTRLVLDNFNMNRFPHLPTRIIKVYTEALLGLVMLISRTHCFL